QASSLLNAGGPDAPLFGSRLEACATFGRLFVVALTLAWLPGAVAKEPANLEVLKIEIRTYIDSGEYDRDIAVVAAQATAWLEARVKQGGSRLTLVMDLDETLFSNLPLIRGQDFAYNAANWNTWVAEGKAPAIGPALEIYRVARRLGIDVVFLTGRRDHRDRAGTGKNLRAIGCADYAALILKPDESKERTGVFKLAERKRLEADGRVIIANVGDQDSDLEGGEAERSFKFPSPFYLTK
ncbi:MAG: acid phosphatase, partial [Verrucomicrobia bacterium]|nr:acid phosphatase [Verrucomicrobiota bacterium]